MTFIADYIGRSPIAVPLLVMGKISYLASALFFIVKEWNLAPMLYDSAVTRSAGAILYVAGILLVAAAIVRLGSSVAVGIPERETELRTRGVYRLSRNPIYLGAFLMCAGSCLFAMHALNFLLAAVTVAIHVRIVAKEEEFLERRFGAQWLAYRQQVPRFLGLPRRATHVDSRAGV